MSENGHSVGIKTPDELEVLTTAPHTDTELDKMRRAVREVMEITDVTYHVDDSPIRIRGRFLIDSEEAWYKLRPQFEAVSHTPKFKRTDGLDVVTALPQVFEPAKKVFPWRAWLLFIVTVYSVFVVGFGMSDATFLTLGQYALYQATGNEALILSEELLPSPQDIQRAALDGLGYMVALIGILGAHEMGHYLMARKYKVNTTPPFFIPLPIPGGFGTMGAVIAMREPPANRKIRFDIGVAGPIAGLVVAIPVIIIGLLLSEVSTVSEVVADLPPILFQNGDPQFLSEGNSLLYVGLKFLIFGEILPNGARDVWIHPVAFAGWFGLLVTALNLLPMGQLDGGHVLYGLLGDKSLKLRLPIIIVLAVLALGGTLYELEVISRPFGWAGWWIWILLLIFVVGAHAPTLDEITELDRPRRIIGWAMVVVFFLLFTPSPLLLITA